jgi:hypothetical protein
MLELTDGLKALLKETAERLKGHERRRFMAQTVKELGTGGQRLAERELGWHRDLIRKGKREVESGIVCVDAFELRGRKLTEQRLPNLLIDISNIVDSQSQTDPKFKTSRSKQSGENKTAKKVEMTEPIFEQLAIVNKQAKDDPTILRLSLDAKATVKIGNFARGGKTRAEAEGNDHDFNPKEKVTPYGIFLPELSESYG